MRIFIIAAVCAACTNGVQQPRAVEPRAVGEPRIVSDARVSLRIDTSEADAALAIIGESGAESGGDAAWQRLVTTPAYRRLEARETSMKRTIDPAELRAHLDKLAAANRGPELRAAVARWQTIDLRAIADRIFAYLPAEAKIEATIYPVIKPRENSFVFFDGEGAAIFIYVDPSETAAAIDNTIAHELHHIGYSSLGEPSCDRAPATCTARTWVGAFGEGFAMLAAAGGPDVHPRGTGKRDQREYWDTHVSLFDDQLAEVQTFLQAVLDGTLDDEAARARGMELFGIQGPWYTAGWTMAVAVERCLGRSTLVAAMKRPWTILATYNAARAQCPTTSVAMATWDHAVIDALGE